MCLVQLQSKQHIHSFMQQIFIECILSAGHCSGHWEIIDEKHGQGPYFMELTLWWGRWDYTVKQLQT